MSLSPQARINAQRVLDAAAQRLLEERNRDASAYGCPVHVLKCLMSLHGVVKHTCGVSACEAGYGVSA